MSGVSQLGPILIHIISSGIDRAVGCSPSCLLTELWGGVTQQREWIPSERHGEAEQGAEVNLMRFN